jgi:hypothetical protein
LRGWDRITDEMRSAEMVGATKTDAWETLFFLAEVAIGWLIGGVESNNFFDLSGGPGEQKEFGLLTSVSWSR